MSTPAKKASNLEKQSTATAAKKATPSGKRARKQAKTAAMRAEDDPPTEKAVLSAAEGTPSKPSATRAKLVFAPKNNSQKNDKSEYGDGERDESVVPPKKKRIKEKSKKVLSQKTAGENVTKSKECEDDGQMALNENEDKGTSKKPGKRKKKVPKESATPETKRPKMEEKRTEHSLYLGNLNSAKDSEEIKEAITRFFTKNSLTVCSVRISGAKEFGFAYFDSAADLQKAFEMNGGKILGLECIMKSRNREGLAEITREREAQTLFVKNLPYSTTASDLQDVFTNAVNIRLTVRKDGSARGMAYIEFQSEAEAEKAFKKKQGADVKGRPVILDYTGDKSKKRLVDKKTLIVSNISKKATESSLKEAFQKAISITIKQHNNVKQKGVALVEFSTEEDANEALESSNNLIIEGLKVHLMVQGAQPAQTKTLFVRGLSTETTENSLREAFDGAVGCRVITHQKTGACRGFGFVDFSTSADASAAKEAMEGFEICGNLVTLEFAKSKAEGNAGFGGRSEDGKGEGKGGKGRRGKKMVKGSNVEGVEGEITGKGTGGKKVEKAKERIGGRGGKLGFSNGRGGERGVRGVGGRMASSRGGGDGRSGFVGKGGGRGDDEQGKGDFGGRGRSSKGRFGSRRGGLASRGGGSARGEK